METPLLTELFLSIRDETPRNIWGKDERIDEVKLKEEVKYVIANRNQLNKLISILFERKYKSSQNIFNSIRDIITYLGFNDYANELAGNVFLEILNGFSQTDSEKVLEELADASTRYIWSVLHSLPYVFSQYKLDPNFVANWFYKIGENIKQDLASGVFFDALDNYAYSFPEEGAKVLLIYLEQDFIGLQETLGSIILGSSRAAIRNKNLPNTLVAIEEKLKNSPAEIHRYVFYNSWVATYLRNASSFEEILKIINEAINGKEKEIIAAFFIVFRIVVKDLEDEKIILPTLDWLNRNASDKLPAEAKFQVVNSLYQLINFDKNAENLRNRKSIYLSIFSKILPVESAYLGTWKKIEEVLTGLLEKKSDSFSDFLDVIIKQSFNSFLELLSQDHFEHLEYTLSNSIADEVFTKLIFSESEKDRLIAIELFRKLKVVTIKSNNIKPNESVLSKLLLEFSKSVLLEKSSEFLLMLEPYFRNVNDELKNEFITEMVFQAANFRGACFEKWSKIENPSEILKIVIERSNNYYEKLKKVSNLPARSFTYYKFSEAAELERRVQSRELNKKVRERSVLLSLIKHTQILYGDKWAFQNNVGEEKARKFNEIRYSVELPRIENIDPEGMVLRRMFINANLQSK